MRFTVLFLVGMLVASATLARAETIRVYIGTYTGPNSKGIYLADFDTESGKLSNARVAAEVANPSFLAIHPNRKFLYAVSEVSDGKTTTGAVVALSINPEDGTLKILNHQSSEGAGPCHLVVDKTGKAVLVANYGGGSIASLPLNDDGTLNKAASAIQHTGSSKDQNRQKEPHAHSINLDPSNRFALVADLGLDKVLVYKFDAATGKLEANDPPFATVEPGSGPRHLAFNPTGQIAYVINEMASTITAFRFDADKGELKSKETVSTLPKEGFKGEQSTAEVVVHRSGKFAFGSNRGHNSIASYVIQANGDLVLTHHQGKNIKTPRNFAIDPTGKFLLVCNQDSNSIVVFRIDQNDGELTPVGEPFAVPMPVCIRFWRAEK
jgi:6-phosphogluconolactonase